jgi:hypothetical protein
MKTIISTRPEDPYFQLFENFPKTIYPATSNRLLIPEGINEDFLKSGYMLMEGSRVVARAALYENPDLKFNGKKSWCIGNYEAIDDASSGSELLRNIISVAKANGAEFVIGPMNGSTWDNYRFSTAQDQPDFFTEPAHHQYYNDHFQIAGFGVIARYHSNIANISAVSDPEITKRDLALADGGVVIRPINLAQYERELEKIHEFNSFAFSSNFLYTPIKMEAFIRKYSKSKTLLNPKFTLVAEDRNSNIIGYYLCLDDLFNKTQKSLIFKTLVRHPDPKWRGLGHVMGNRIYQKAFADGYESFIHPFIYDKGTSVNLSKDFSGRHLKNYVLYGKEIS